jgi:ABC transport system ATP-binding/permease protein
MISYLQAENISRRIGDNLLFEKIDLNINRDDKIAIVAVNGAGKSSLLDIISGRENPDSGSVTLKRDLKTGYLMQNPQLDESNRIIDELFSADNDIARLVREYEECLIEGTPEMLHDLIRRMDESKAWDYEVRAKQILFRLDLTDLHAIIGHLSGGQKKRVALAKVLVGDSDLLILDEPTNHLDLEMTEWLEEYLTRSARTILMVTHDRYFLERVCNVILEMTDDGMFRYDGNYEYFLVKRQERENSARLSVEKAQNLLRTELEWMRRMPKARRHKAKSRIESFYETKDKAARRPEEKSISINSKVSRIGRKILDLKKVNKAYGEKHLINDFTYSFARYEKVGLVGPNGSGKTTLLDIITGLKTPDSGTVERGETIVFGYYRQEGIAFREDMTVIDAVKDIAEQVRVSDGNALPVSQFLNHFLFPPSKQYTYIRKLSGGERRRLYLCTVLMKNPNFLILDEPTNDLDIITLNVLEDYLANFPGCVIVVSHDRYFMDKVVDHIFEYKGDGVIKDFPGNYTQLRDMQEEEASGSTPQSETVTREKPAREKKSGLTFMEKKELESLSTEIGKLESEKKRIEEELSSGTVSTQELYQLSQKHGEVMKTLDEKEMRWLELSEK